MRIHVVTCVNVHVPPAFLSELSAASNEYSEQLASGDAADEVLRKLAWNVDDLSCLNDGSRQMCIESQQLRELAEGPEESFLAHSAPRRLQLLRKKMLDHLQGLYRFRHQAATHIIVLVRRPVYVMPMCMYK